ncbi:MAG: hypothetical protein U1F76_24000 [Candidatus Competibacteraceae bacterium]
MIEVSDLDKEELYKLLGKVLLEFSRFEYIITLCLFALNGTNFSNLEAVRDEIDSHFEKTMGRLVNELKNTMNIGDTFSYHLSEIVHFRNWICHKIPRGMYIYFSEDYEFKRLLSRIRGMSDKCSSIRMMLEKWLQNEPRNLKIDELPEEFRENYLALSMF